MSLYTYIHKIDNIHKGGAQDYRKQTYIVKYKVVVPKILLNMNSEPNLIYKVIKKLQNRIPNMDILTFLYLNYRDALFIALINNQELTFQVLVDRIIRT